MVEENVIMAIVKFEMRSYCKVKTGRYNFLLHLRFTETAQSIVYRYT